MYRYSGLGFDYVDPGGAPVMCPDGSMVGAGAFCPGQTPTTSGLPVAYGPDSTPVAVMPVSNMLWWLAGGALLLLLVKR